MTREPEAASASTATCPDSMLPSLFRVHAVRAESRDTFTLELLPPAGEPPLRFLPGQFNMLYAFGAGECAISISSDSADPKPLMHTTRIVGTVTRALSVVRPGDAVGVRGPFGSAWPLSQAEGQDVVFVAGGIGLAPLRPAILHVLAARERYGKVVVLYGARTPQDVLYRRQLERWSGRLDVDVLVSVDRAESQWRGNVGVVTALIRRAPFDRLNTTAFVCGPEVMMHLTVQELTQRGVPEERIYLSLERNMKCAIGFCGHCQFGPTFICKDGPVFRYDRVRPWLEVREI